MRDEIFGAEAFRFLGASLALAALAGAGYLAAGSVLQEMGLLRWLIAGGLALAGSIGGLLVIGVGVIIARLDERSERD